jgi:hypothetical protein
MMAAKQVKNFLFIVIGLSQPPATTERPVRFNKELLHDGCNNWSKNGSDRKQFFMTPGE